MIVDFGRRINKRTNKGQVGGDDLPCKILRSLKQPEQVKGMRFGPRIVYEQFIDDVHVTTVSLTHSPLY